jgi:hypothetical protein
MIVVVDANGSRLEDAANFKELKVSAPRRVPLDDLGRVEAEHVWLPVDGLVALPGAPSEDGDWQAGLAGMLEYARSRGWVDPTGAVRAHVEWR